MPDMADAAGVTLADALTEAGTTPAALLAASPLAWSLCYVCHAVSVPPMLSFEERERDAGALKMIVRDRAGCSKKPSRKSLKLRDLAPVNVKISRLRRRLRPARP